MANVSSNVIGSVGSAHDVVVDPRGGVGVGGRPWSLGWWVGAADRWHEPGSNSLQHRVDGLPVVETSLRVPGGQVVHRAWGVAGPGGRQLAVVDVENRSKEAVAVALVVRGGRRLAYDGDRTVLVDGAPAVVLARRPARTRTGDDDALRVALGNGEGDAPASFTVERTGAAFVLPLAHTATLRVVVPLDGDGSGLGDLDLAGLPDPETVLRGWRGHVDAGVRVGVPDERLTEAIVAARSTLLIQADRSRPVAETAAIVAALDGWGHHDAAAVAADPLLDLRRMNGSFIQRKQPDPTAAVLAALGGHARVTGDADWAEPFIGLVAKAAHRLAKAGGPASAQRDAADLLEVAGQPDAAELCRERAATLDDPPPPPPAAVATDTADPALVLLGARAVLVDDAAPGRVDLLPSFPDEWLGQDVEAHRLPTRSGPVSFAVRWHGARPALLWERDPATPCELRCPGLDPTWSTDAASGEALLNPVEPAGGLPKVVAPLSGQGTPAGEAEDEQPGSFR